MNLRNGRRYTTLEKILALLFAHILILAMMYLWILGFDIAQISFLVMTILSVDFYIIGYKGNQEALEFERERNQYLLDNIIMRSLGIERKIVVRERNDEGV